MTNDEAVGLLSEAGRTGKLATASPSGNPHVAPVWFVVDGDDLVFTTGQDTIKARHLRANPRASLAVEVEAYPHSFVIVRGPVSVESGAANLQEWTTRIAARYVPAGRAEEYGRRNAVPEELLCRLRMERVTGSRDIAL